MSQEKRTREETEERERGQRDGGRVVYSRLPSGAEPERARGQGAAASFARLAREPVAPTLPVLVGSFVLLIGLVFALGAMSAAEVTRVGEETLQMQKEQTARLQFLLELRDALARLDFEARERGTRELQGGIRNPFDAKLGNARDIANARLKTLEHMPLAQTEQGRAFLASANDFIEGTKEADVYSTAGFVKFRDLSGRMESLLQDANRRQQEIESKRLVLDDQARRRIRTLTYLAVLLSALIAAASVWELQRRFRQLRRSLEEARRERAFSAQMLEGMVAAVAAIDGHDRIRSANEAFFRLFPRASVGSSVHDEIAPADALKMFAAATASRVEHATRRGRWALAPEGADAPRHFEVYSSPLEIDGEHGQILTLFDVTEAAQNEEELRRKDALAAVGQAAAQVAHEIKNPLGSIRLGVAMLRDMTRGEEAHSTIDLVERGIEHLNKLTVDVTQYSREKPLELARVDLRRLLDSSLELVADRIAEKQTPVERDYGAEPLEGRLDADQLRQVFVNLVANAVDASPASAPLRITARRTEDRPPAPHARGDGASPARVPHARVTIADRGPGMDEQTRARLFEPFFTTKKRGTGLGLAIARKIVEQHGGAISVESTPGEGTSFHVDLPLRS